MWSARFSPELEPERVARLSASAPHTLAAAAAGTDGCSLNWSAQQDGVCEHDGDFALDQEPAVVRKPSRFRSVLSDDHDMAE